MDFISIAEAARFGMNFERSRVELASSKLAMANFAYSSETAALSAAKELSAQFQTLLGSEYSSFLDKNSPVKKVHDPGNPMANINGDVFFANIDPIHEMATLVSAIRSYEANVRAYNTNSEMNSAALSIGGNR